MTGSAGKHDAVCLLHGWGFDHRVLAGFAEKFLPEWCTKTLVMPGYDGPGRRVPGLEEVARKLLPDIPDNSVLIGWSLGGMVAIRIAAMKKIRQLILLASTPCFVTKSDWPYGTDPGLVRELARRVRKNPGRALREFALLCSRGDSDPHTTYRALTLLLKGYEISTGVLHDGLDMLCTADLRRDFSGLQCCVGVILAANDALVPASMAGALLSLKPDLIPGVVDSAGHALFISRPEQTRSLLLSLLSHRSHD